MTRDSVALAAEDARICRASVFLGASMCMISPVVQSLLSRRLDVPWRSREVSYVRGIDTEEHRNR
jgi:hypothetical protein